MLRTACLLVFTGAVAVATRAHAQPTETAAPSLPSTDVAPDAPVAVDDNDTVRRAELDELRDKLQRLEQQTQERISPLSLNGYVDFGFFVPLGNSGVGWKRNSDSTKFTEYSKYGWLFYGDILATAVNSRGEVADLGDGSGIDRFDSINSNGAPGFLVNEVNMRLSYQIADRAILRTSVNFAPRTSRRDFELGDFMDVDLAEVEWSLTDDGKTSIFVGKMLPVFGIEYKERKSDQRFGITPSLVQRYTSGPQLGLKFRSKLLNDWIVLAGSVTNNSPTTEQFSFSSEIDQNSGKFLNGRGALSIPLGKLGNIFEGHRLEAGYSISWGPQDRARDNSGNMRLMGVDLQYLGADLALKAQIMKGKAPGNGVDVWHLYLRWSGYAELTWQFLPYLGILGRAEYRNADVSLGTERFYITRSARFTGGLRAVINPHIFLKAEYLRNVEYSNTPEFDNDIVTTSLVMAY